VINPGDKDLIYDEVPWKRLQGARILISGGSGFIGHWLQIAKGCHVVSLNELQYQYGDWDKHAWDYIIHLAPPPPLRAIRCADVCGAKILYASSGAVFDKDLNDYGTGKLLGEAQLLTWGGKYAIARMFTFCGGWMRNHFAVTNYIMDAMQGGPIRIRGDNVTRGYMYAADMAVWLWHLLLDGNGIYDVGSAVPCTMFELAIEIRHQFHPMPEIVEDRIYGPDARPNYLPQGLDMTANELGVCEYTPFQPAILKTVDWYKDYLHNA